jgi:hypothetical protein
MFRDRFLRTSAVALILYGVLGLFTSLALLVVGSTTLARIETLQTTLERERSSLVGSLRTASATLRDTASASNAFEKSIDGARDSADTASKLANDTAGTFRDLSVSLNISVFGIQPLAGLSPQFVRGADQLQQLAISLGTTREALGQNRSDIQRVTSDLSQLQGQLDAVAASLSRPGVLGLGDQAVLPFQIAFYGMCLLVVLQSAFSIVAGVALYRLQRVMGSASLFPHLERPALPPGEGGVTTATTMVAHDGERGRARGY